MSDLVFVKKQAWLCGAVFALIGGGFSPARAEDAGLKTLPGHVLEAVVNLPAKGILPATDRLNLAIGLALRDDAGLADFLARVYNPADADYRHYVTPAEFTQRFGPSEADYAAVIQFAQTNHLTVTATHGNRLLLDVNGAAADVQRAFHITLRAYQHPTEARDFFAPDAEPSVNASLPIADVSGLNNYARPHPMIARRSSATPADATPNTGSSPTGDYMGKDFRAAYLPDVTLTGLGQSVGLVEFDGFYLSDILAYQTAARLPAVPIRTVLVDGYDGTPSTNANDEVSLDIEMAISMAPGLAEVVVFEAPGSPSGLQNDILNAMAANSQIHQFSCSWGWAGGPSATTDNIFRQMAAQGQSFFHASGDSDAFTLGARSSNGVDSTTLSRAPSSSPYITQVGGTTLTTLSAGGAYASETAWNWGLSGSSYAGTSGGVSSHYPIPDWQTNVSMAANGGSTSARNIPDVALVADGVYVLYGHGSRESLGGTSCSAPLWAGLAALINQQAATAGRPPIGLINSAVYALGASNLYASAFHDITNGNNVTAASPNQYYAVAGYDLCTGWGTPAGQSLIDALAGPADNLRLTPPTGLAARGPVGGPFDVASETLLLTNAGSSALSWSLINTSAWLIASSASGAIAGGESMTLTLSLASAAASLDVGAYSATLVFTNLTSQTAQLFVCNAQIGQSILLNGDFEWGDFSYWTLVGNSTSPDGIYYNVVEDALALPQAVHSGVFGAFLGDTNVAKLSQTLSTVPGQKYLLSLWLDNPTNGGPQSFAVLWDTNVPIANYIYRLTSPPALSWTNLVFLVTATHTNSMLQFAAQNNTNGFGLDDVSVTPIPALQLQATASANDNLTLAWTAAAGLAYQVQYATDLVRSNWITLGASILATNTYMTVSDTNAVQSSQQRFYRLVAKPAPPP